MAGAKGAGTAQLKASLEKVEAADAERTQRQNQRAAKAPAGSAHPNRRASDPQEQKTGVSVEKVRHQAHAEAEAEDHVRVVDHDQNEVLFSGPRAQYNRLKKAIQAGEE